MAAACAGIEVSTILIPQQLQNQATAPGLPFAYAARRLDAEAGRRRVARRQSEFT